MTRVLGSARAAAEAWEVLRCEHVGSVLDVMDAIGDLLLDHGVEQHQLQSVCSALFESIGAHRAPPLHSLPLPVPRRGAGLDALEWKREFKGHAARFEQDYAHPLQVNATGQPEAVLTLQQRPFRPEGFASTVWDSSIVLSRMLEHRGLQTLTRTPRGEAVSCVELGAGCGLVGLTLAALGGDVVITDLPENLRLLRANVRANSSVASRVVPRVRPLTWGVRLSAELLSQAPYDLVVATDVFYARESMPALVDTLLELSGPSSAILLAAGRNRHAETEFFSLARKHWSVVQLQETDLHPTYQAEDVAVWRLDSPRSHASSGEKRSGGQHA